MKEVNVRKIKEKERGEEKTIARDFLDIKRCPVTHEGIKTRLKKRGEEMEELKQEVIKSLKNDLKNGVYEAETFEAKTKLLDVILTNEINIKSFGTVVDLDKMILEENKENRDRSIEKAVTKKSRLRNN